MINKIALIKAISTVIGICGMVVLGVVHPTIFMAVATVSLSAVLVYVLYNAFNF